MTRLQKIRNSLFGVAMMVAAAVMAYKPKDAYGSVIVFMALGFLVTSVATLGYYFTMAKYMVGGRMVLYRGVVLFDFAVLTGSITDVPRFYVIIYLAVLHLFSGLVEILRSREARVSGGRGWRLKLFHGIFNMSIAIGCIVLARRVNTAVYMYCFGIFYSGLIRVIQSFRKTTFVYIR